MSALHVMWSQPWQPFTDFLLMDEIRIQHSDRKLTRCYECRDLRWAKYLKIRVEYDSVEIRCADGCYGERNRDDHKT